MNVDNKAKVDHILLQVGAGIHVPDSSPELLKAVGLPQFTLYVQMGLHLERGAMDKCGSTWTFPGVPPCL